MGETIWVVGRFLAGCWLLAWVRRPRAAGVARQPCSIIVPARNEARTLPNLLESLRPQLRHDDQLVVVDDDSADETADVAARGGAVVISAPPLIEGSVGKPNACAAGAAAATRDTLVFLDADVSFEPGGLDRVVGTHRGGLLSVQPYHRTQRPYERASLFFNLIAMMGTDAFTPIGSRVRPRGAFGPCLVTSRADYEAVGGHAAVRHAVLDDVELARRYEEHGLAVTCLGGHGSVSFRMYPDGVRQLVEGWNKNIVAGATRVRRVTLLLTVAWVSLCIQAPWYGPWVYAAVVMQLAWMARRVGRFGVMALLLFPIPLFAFLAVFVRSMYMTLVRRRLVWKGREFKPEA